MVERELRDVNELVPYANNPRLNMNAVPKVAESIRRFGFLGAVIIDGDGTIVAGHTRIMACKQLLESGDCGLWGNGKLNEADGTCDGPKEPTDGRHQGIAPFVPVVCADYLTEDELRAFRIVDNRTNELSEWDFDLLAEELDLLKDSEIDMADFGFIPSQDDGEVDFGNLEAMLGEKDQAYLDFEAKFKEPVEKPKATTDDCFTPPAVYDAVKKWVLGYYDIPKGTEIVRPFYPGGDYQAYEYPKDCLVLDNPPFSITRKIIQFYNDHGIRYFLFVEGMTAMVNHDICNAVIAGFKVVYENGVTLSTSFVTNLGDDRVVASASLHDAMMLAQTDGPEARTVYDWPDNVINAGLLQKLPKYGVSLTIRRDHATRKVGTEKTGVYGGGALVSDKDAKRWRDAVAQAEARKAEGFERIQVELTPEERAIIARLGAEQDALSENRPSDRG